MKIFAGFCAVYQIVSIFCESATIPPQTDPPEDTLDVLREDVTKIGSGIESFTFHLLKNIVQYTESDLAPAYYEYNNTQEAEKSGRSKRAVSDAEFQEICAKHIQESKHLEELKGQVLKLQELVVLLRDQQRIINIFKNETGVVTPKQQEMREIPEGTDELEIIRLDLRHAFQSLNQTRQVVDFERMKNEDLRIELDAQKAEIKNIKNILMKYVNVNNNFTTDDIVGNQFIDNSTSTDQHQAQGRASTSDTITQISKLISQGSKIEGVASTEDLNSKITKLQSDLLKAQLEAQMIESIKRNLAKKILEDETTSTKHKDLADQIIAALAKQDASAAPAAQSKTDLDLDITGLDDLQEAINKLRPKENVNINTASGGMDNVQFQVMLNKLLNNNNNNNRPSLNLNSNSIPNSNSNQKFTLSPQQVEVIRKTMIAPAAISSTTYNSGSNSQQFICRLDDRGYNAPSVPVVPNYVNNNYRGGGGGGGGNKNYAPSVPAAPVNNYHGGGAGGGGNVNYAPPAAPVAPNNNYQLFPVQPNYDNAPNTYAANPDKSGYYQADNKYQEDLKNQIDGLQAAIDGLNRPEYITKPEDQAMVADLEQQISDLRGIVYNLNGNEYDNGYRRRRSVDNVDNHQENLETLERVIQKLFDKSDNATIVDNFEKLVHELLDYYHQGSDTGLGFERIRRSVVARINDYDQDNFNIIEDFGKLINKFLNTSDNCTLLSDSKKLLKKLIDKATTGLSQDDHQIDNEISKLPDRAKRSTAEEKDNDNITQDFGKLVGKFFHKSDNDSFLQDSSIFLKKLFHNGISRRKRSTDDNRIDIDDNSDEIVQGLGKLIKKMIDNPDQQNLRSSNDIDNIQNRINLLKNQQ